MLNSSQLGYNALHLFSGVHLKSFSENSHLPLPLLHPPAFNLLRPLNPPATCPPISRSCSDPPSSSYTSFQQRRGSLPRRQCSRPGRSPKNPTLTALDKLQSNQETDHRAARGRMGEETTLEVCEMRSGCCV